MVLRPKVLRAPRGWNLSLVPHAQFGTPFSMGLKGHDLRKAGDIEWHADTCFDKALISQVLTEVALQLRFSAISEPMCVVTTRLKI